MSRYRNTYQNCTRLLDEDIIPRHGIWNAMQDFKVLKSNVYRHFEGDSPAAHKLKAQAGAAAQAKRDAESMGIAMRVATIALKYIAEGRSYKAFERDMGACAHITGADTGTTSHSEQQQQRQQRQQQQQRRQQHRQQRQQQQPIPRRGGTS